ncbi:MAG: selenium metabolism-associated LysR family transcriptional regulator [Oscillospiraceae bacterium]
MNFRQLEAFVYVIKYRSFSKAAEAIFISQPTVSVHIGSLEDELGVPLIVRAPKGIFPTEAGKIFYGHAMQILKLRDKSIEEIKKYSDKVCGSLEIASSTVPAQYIIPEVLPQITNEYPNIFVSINQLDSNGVVERVENMQVEVGICGTKIDKSTCDFQPFVMDELVLITPNSEEFKNITTPELLSILFKYPFISREKGSGTRSEMESTLLKYGVNTKELKVITQMESTEGVIQSVKNGMGISVVSKCAVSDFVSFGKLLSFEFEEKMERPFYIVTRKNRPLTRQAEIFIEEIKKYNFNY